MASGSIVSGLCARWCSSGPRAARVRGWSGRGPVPARSCCGSRPAASAGPTSTSVDGELPRPKLPLVLGHEIVGIVEATGPGRDAVRARATRIGVPWLGWTCGECRFCRSRTGEPVRPRPVHGLRPRRRLRRVRGRGRALCFALPPATTPSTPRRCSAPASSAIASLVAAGDAERLGLYGFGAAAHIVAQVARHQGRRVFAFTRPGDVEGQRFARELGAEWAGGSDEPPPEPLDAAIIFAPVGALVPTALRATDKGGTRGLRGHPHVAHPVVSVRHPLGRARRPVGGEPDAAGRRGVLPPRPSGAARDRHGGIAAGPGQRGAGRVRAGRVRGAAVLRPSGAAGTRAVRPMNRAERRDDTEAVPLSHSPRKTHSHPPSSTHLHDPCGRPRRHSHWPCHSRTTGMRRISSAVLLRARRSSYSPSSLARRAIAAAQETGTVTGTVTRAGEGSALSSVSVIGRGHRAEHRHRRRREVHPPAGRGGPAADRVPLARLPADPGGRDRRGGRHGDGRRRDSSRSPIALCEIVVEGASRAPERIVEAPAAISVVPPEVLQSASITGQAPMALQAVPGVDIVQSGVNDFNVNARGFNSSLNRRVLVLQDGRDLAIAFLGSQEWNGLTQPLEDLGKVEMVRGPGLRALRRQRVQRRDQHHDADRARGARDQASPSPAASSRPSAATSATPSLFAGDRLGFRVNAGYNRSDTWSRTRTRLDGTSLQREYADATDEPVGPVARGAAARRARPSTPSPATPSATATRSRTPTARPGSTTTPTTARCSRVDGGASQVQNEIFVTGIGRVQVAKAIKPYARAGHGGRPLQRLRLLEQPDVDRSAGTRCSRACRSRSGATSSTSRARTTGTSCGIAAGWCTAPRSGTPG